MIRFHADGVLDLSSLLLTEEEVAERRHFVGASDMPIIMSGNEAKIEALAAFKRGGQAEDLSREMSVMLGIYTEPFNAAWYQQLTERPLIYPGTRVVHPTIPHFAASPDGMTLLPIHEPGVRATWQAKHVGGFKPIDDVVRYYMPQLVAEAMCAGVEYMVISIMAGNSKLHVFDYEFDALYGAEVLAAAEAFWARVQNGAVNALPQRPPVPTPIGRSELDLSDHDEWRAAAHMYLAMKPRAKAFDAAKEMLGRLLPPDVKMGFGCGVKAVRDKRGIITVREHEEKSDD